ncbi:ArsR family transcriptional regulator [Rhodobacteraceae bacterium CCMM004]|nr:ArsR family transcriptional regulator [Rhodobacteraceae bacterium CCMM004]
MDAIFKALNDPARRALLDSLRREDGQTLTQLQSQFDMTRFGVMKHLSVLEAASLITAVKRGRFKYHYLNAVPLQEVLDRWIEPLLAAPAARGMLTLKSELEKDAAMTDTTKPDLVLHTYIACTRNALWEALTSGAARARYHFASDRVEGNFAAEGDEVRLLKPDGGRMLTERVISITPKDRIETTFQPGWVEAVEASRVVFSLDEIATGMKLTIEHYGLGEGTGHVNEGWSKVLAGLKTYLETGEGHRFYEEAMSA